MKVRCVRYFDSQRRPADNSAWLTLDRVYHVMGIHTCPDGKRDYLIIANDRDPGFAAMGYHPAESFEVLTHVTPPNWSVTRSDGEEYVFPAAWLEPGFFDAFYDRDPDAYAIFERERDIVLSSDR